MLKHVEKERSKESSYLKDIVILDVHSKLFIKLHGSLMVLAWIGSASLGLLLARYYKSTFKSKLLGKDQWFVWHRYASLVYITPGWSDSSFLSFRFFMMVTWALTLTSFGVIYYELGGLSDIHIGEDSHAILGCLTTAFAFVQPFAAALRPAPTSPRYLFVQEIKCYILNFLLKTDEACSTSFTFTLVLQLTTWALQPSSSRWSWTRPSCQSRWECFMKWTWLATTLIVWQANFMLLAFLVVHLVVHSVLSLMMYSEMPLPKKICERIYRNRRELQGFGYQGLTPAPQAPASSQTNPVIDAGHKHSGNVIRKNCLILYLVVNLSVTGVMMMLITLAPIDGWF